MVAENPGPDNDTMLTLIETNDQLQLAMSKHQRAVLQTRKSLGLGIESGRGSPNGSTGVSSGFISPPGPPVSTKPASSPPPRDSDALPVPPSRTSIHIPEKDSSSPPVPEKSEDPFRDPAVTTTHNPPFPQDNKPPPPDQFQDRLGIEPYHPGFNPTKSYMGRQESSMGKTAMTAAVPETHAELPGDAPLSKQDDNDDYEASKGRVYRY